jgi:hypothetical protein
LKILPNLVTLASKTKRNILFVKLFGQAARPCFSLPTADVIFAQLACTLNGIIFLFTSGIANLFLYTKTLGCS